MSIAAATSGGIPARAMKFCNIPSSSSVPSQNVQRIPLHARNETSGPQGEVAVELLAFAEELEVENASTLRKQELMFAILKQLAAQETDIIGEGVVEVLQDGFGFLRSPDANYLPARTTSTSRRRRSGASRCGPATRSKARSAARRTASAISRCSRSTRSISRIRRRRATRSTSTT